MKVLPLQNFNSSVQFGRKDKENRKTDLPMSNAAKLATAFMVASMNYGAMAQGPCKTNTSSITITPNSDVFECGTVVETADTIKVFGPEGVTINNKSKKVLLVDDADNVTIINPSTKTSNKVVMKSCENSEVFSSGTILNSVIVKESENVKVDVNGGSSYVKLEKGSKNEVTISGDDGGTIVNDNSNGSTITGGAGREFILDNSEGSKIISGSEDEIKRNQ